MRTFLFLPPVRRPAGGVAVILRLAEALRRSGREAVLVARERSGWLPEATAVPVLAWDDLRLTPGDLWLVPEGWVNALTPGLEARARCLVYCQNWAYLFSALPEGVQWSRLPVEFLAVSDPVAWFMEQCLGRRPAVLRPGIDLGRFRPLAAPPAGRPRVAFMPRKNKALAQQIRAVFESRNGPDRLDWLAIDGLDSQGVAQALQQAHIFLVTGFPEGCPLPPLEAMACGCLPVGCSGFGGWDYMRPAQAAPRFAPWWPLRPVPWGGNGFWCADGDVLDAALCLEQAAGLIGQGGPELAALLAAGQDTARAYGLEAFEAAVPELWAELER